MYKADWTSHRLRPLEFLQIYWGRGRERKENASLTTSSKLLRISYKIQGVICRMIMQTWQMERTNHSLQKATYWINFIYSFTTFIALTTNPMSIEVGTYPIQYFAWKPIIFPLLSVEFQHTLIHQIFTILKLQVCQYCCAVLRYDQDV